MPLRRYRNPQAEALKPPDQPKAKPRNNGKHPGGRPPIYAPHILEQAKRICQLYAATDAELAQYFGVSVLTIWQWRTDHPEFSRAVNAAKQIADARVERRLYEKAVGYSHDAVKIFLRAADKKPVIVPYMEHFPPDSTAQIFWLKNRQPEKWRDRHEIDAAVVAVTANVEPLELAQRIAFLLLNGASVIEQGGAELVDQQTQGVPADE